MGNTSGVPQVSDDEPCLGNETVKETNLHIENSPYSEIMFGAGVLGNVLALFVLFRSGPRQRRTIFYRLVAGLTITDLVGTSLTSPFVIAVHENDFQWIGGQVLCTYFGYVMIFAGYATMLIICCMSVERVICVKHPCFYRTRSSPRHATYILVICWILAAFIASFPLMGFGNIVLQFPYTWCFFDYYSSCPANKAFNYFYAIFAILIISITVCCYVISMCTLFFNCRQKPLLPGKSTNSRKFNKSKRYRDCQMLVQLAGITIVFSTCYVPLMVKVLINQNSVLPRNYKSDFIVIRLASVNQILDPWVYILFRRELLWKIISAFKSCINRNSSPDIIPTKSNYDCDMCDNCSCCTFCFHCLCDPPTTLNASDSVSSVPGRRISTVILSTPPDIRRTIF